MCLLVLFQRVERVMDILKSSFKQPQSKEEEFKQAILYFPGSFVTRRLFIQGSRRGLKSITVAEFKKAVKELSPDFGQVESKVLHKQQTFIIFFKKNPRFLPHFEGFKHYEEMYRKKYKYSKNNLNSCVYQYLVEKGVITGGDDLPSPTSTHYQV